MKRSKKRATSTKRRLTKPQIRQRATDTLGKLAGLSHTPSLDLGKRLWKVTEIPPIPAPTPDMIQIGGAHYKTADPAQQHWNLVVSFGWDYFTAQATKYMFRWLYKGGNEDLKKARHYLDKLIELVDNGWLPDWKGSKSWQGGEPGRGYTNQD